ncbi:transcriptional activator RfaH [Alcanivorax sp. IO_7]|nr:transcriptional activator RfaH [Alcanivorax sp. IO_7]
MNDSAWYVVQCRANQNFRAQENLENQGFTCFQPRIRVEKLHAGRRTHRTEPLFPGYLFIRFEEYGPSWHTVRSTRGVNKLVAFGERPARVPGSVVEALMQSSQARERGEDAEPAIRPGDRLRIERGPSPTWKPPSTVTKARKGPSCCWTCCTSSTASPWPSGRAPPGRARLTIGAAPRRAPVIGTVLGNRRQTPWR